MGMNETSHHPGRRVWLAAVAVVVVAAAVASGAAAEEPGVEDQTNYTNYRLAREEVVWAEQNLEASQDRLEQREEELDELVAEASTLVGLEQSLLADLIGSRRSADDFLVAAYVTGRSRALGADLFATKHVLDALYLQSLLEAQVRAVNEAFRNYEQLLANAGDRLVLALDRIEVVHRDIQLARTAIPALQEHLTEAQWVASVAEIHAIADAEFDHHRRIDPSAAKWEALRQCESTGNYQVNTGNGYYGAYQFDQSTWESVGGTGRPHWAEPVEQDARARLLYARRGWQPWPICGVYLR